MRLTSWLVAALCTLTLSAAAHCDELQMASPPPASAERPTRGMSMDGVEAKYGAPVKRVPAVGEPPISRWEYPSFVVYFERHLVLHAVVIG